MSRVREWKLGFFVIKGFFHPSCKNRYVPRQGMETSYTILTSLTPESVRTAMSRVREWKHVSDCIFNCLYDSGKNRYVPRQGMETIQEWIDTDNVPLGKNRYVPRQGMETISIENLCKKLPEVRTAMSRVREWKPCGVSLSGASTIP